MDGLKWPVEKCEACNLDLTEQIPKQAEKSNDEHGNLKWTDFCPRCGYGMFVGERVLPAPNAEELARRAAAPIMKQSNVLRDADPEGQIGGAVATAEPSGVPPDERGAAQAAESDGGSADADPEGQLAGEGSVDSKVGQPEDPMPDNMYWCTKHAKRHERTSAIGIKHLEFAE